MSTLQELTDQYPNTLLHVTKNGVDYIMNRIVPTAVHMNSGESFPKTDSGWTITRQSLEETKRLRIETIDAKTQEVINRGFTYDGKQFSLSGNAQSNWNSLVSRLLSGKLTFPYNVTTIDDDEYTIQSLQSFNDFIDAAVYVVGYNIAYGRSLKLAIKAATNYAGIDAVVDPRV